MTADPRIEQIRAVLGAYYDAETAHLGTEVNVLARISAIVDREPLPDSETEPENWEAGAYIEPGIGGVANVSTSGWPGGVERVWLRVSDYARDNHGADIVLEPDEADEIAGVLRGAARSVRRDRGEVTS